MRIDEETDKIILDGMEFLLAEYAYLCGLNHAYATLTRRAEKKLKEIIELKEKENGKEK